MEKRNGILVIRESCLTGQAVWIYRGPSREAAGRAYRRARSREIEYVRRQRPALLARRKANILRLLSDCMADKPAGAELSQEQKAAARVLVSCSERPPGTGREFYDHIMEERRRREADAKIRRQMRMREISGNPRYDKQEGGR